LWEDAVALVEAMALRTEGLVLPDAKTLSSAISACGGAAQLGHALHLLDLWAFGGRLRVQPTVQLTAAGENAAGELKRWTSGDIGGGDDSGELASPLPAQMLPGAELCLRAAVAACAKWGDWQAAAALIEAAFCVAGLRDEASARAAAAACVASGQHDRARSLEAPVASAFAEAAALGGTAAVGGYVSRGPSALWPPPLLPSPPLRRLEPVSPSVRLTALLTHLPPFGTVVVDAPVGKRGHAMGVVPLKAEGGGKAAGGRAAVSRVLPMAWDGALSVCRVAIETGRTHQIRVHMAHLGHPIIGDR
jgi:hypothetical protein